MLIYTQDRRKVINTNFVSYFDVDILGDGCSNTVYANFENDAPLELGVYVTKENARKVLDKLVQSYSAISVFYIPTDEEMFNE